MSWFFRNIFMCAKFHKCHKIAFPQIAAQCNLNCRSHFQMRDSHIWSWDKIKMNSNQIITMMVISCVSKSQPNFASTVLIIPQYQYHTYKISFTICQYHTYILHWGWGGIIYHYLPLFTICQYEYHTYMYCTEAEVAVQRVGVVAAGWKRRPRRSS